MTPRRLSLLPHVATGILPLPQPTLARRRWRLSLLLAVFGLLVGTAQVAPCAAAGPSGEQSQGDLRFRRVFAPADRMKDWPRGAEKYLPVDAAEFERLLTAARSAGAGTPVEAAVRAAAARYTARLDPDQSLRGEATLEIEQTADHAVMLPLDPCNLAMSRARWLEAGPAPATLGPGYRGDLQTLVEHSGRLRFTWSLAGRRDSAEAVVFAFELPPCPINRLALELPLGLTPSLDRGLLVTSGPAGEELRRWEFELGGHDRFHLRILQSGAAGQPRRLALVRQSMVYDLSLRGVEVSAQLKLEAYDQPLRQVTVAMDPQLQLVTALCGEAAAPWSVVSPPGAAMKRILLTLPAPIRDGGGVLRLRGLAPLLVGEPWRLPRIYPQGMFWQEGKATLLVPAPLLTEQLLPVGCRQSGIGPLPAPQSGEAAQFEYFAPDATVELVLAERPVVLQVRTATATELGNGKLISRVAAEFRTAETPQFSLTARLSRGWTVDSVESSPADVLDDWTFERQEEQRKLTVRLAKALSPSRPVRLVVMARRLYVAPGKDLGLDDLAPLEFLAAADEQPLVTVRAAGQYQLKLAGAETLSRVDPAQLDATEIDLLAEPPGELLFHNDSGAAGLKVALEKRKPGYVARLQVEACAGDETLRENYRLRCAPPPSVRVDRLVVRFSRRRDAPLRWSLGADEQAISARRWSIEEQVAAGRPPEEETWELTFRRPRSKPFEVRATRTSKFAGPQPVSLVSLPEASAEQATLVLRAVGTRSLEIKNHRLAPIPIETAPPGQCQTVRAAYQYDPLRDASAAPEPPLLLWTAEVACVPRSWVWHGELQSHYLPDGTGQHLAGYQLQNCGESSIRLTLPQGVSREAVHGLWIAGIPAAARRGEAGDQSLVIDLPAGQKYPTVTIHFTTHGKRLPTVGRLEPPLPEADVPVLWQHWSVWLPPGYELAEYFPDQERSTPRRLTWSQRLFGCLGRASGQTAFNPLGSEDWRRAMTVGGGLGDRVHGTGARVSLNSGQSAGPKGPWLETRLPGFEADDAPGWTAYRLSAAEVSSPGVVVVHRPTMGLLGMLALLLTAAIAWWTAGHRPLALGVAAGVLAVTALLVPVAVAAIASGALLGVLFCLALGLVRPPGVARPSPGQSDAKTDLPSTVTGVIPLSAVLLAAAIVLAPAAAGGAGPQEQEPRKKSPPPYSVFIPVDERQQPVGGKYYLPEPLYDQLYRRAASAAEKPQGWLLAGGIYRASLAKETASQRLAVDQLHVDFNLHVFSRGARVRIPFRRDEARLLPEGSLLEGRAVQPEWETDGSALVLEVSEPGQYRLELAIQPTARAGGAAGFDLAIPRLATSRLELTLPEGSPPVEAPSALGAVRREEQPARLVAELGPAERLTVRWQEAAGAAPAAPAVDAEELFWLKIQPGSVVIDARLKLKVAAGQLHRLQLAADPCLQLLPLAGPEPPAVQVRTPAGQPQIIELQWAHAVSESAVIDARFLVAGASSVGNLRLPQLDVLDVRPTKRWLAVSVDPALAHREQMPGRLDKVAVPEFAASWGAAEPTPLFAYRLAEGPTQWSVATRPRRPEIAVDQSLALSFDGREATLQLDAALGDSSGYVFQYRLLAPPELKIESIAVSAADAQLAARWTQDRKGAITIFLTGPVAGEHHLLLRGRLPAPQGKKLPLPLVEIDGGHVQSSNLQLFRQAGVLVRLEQVVGWTEVKDRPAEPERPEFGRLVYWLRAAGGVLPRAVLSILPKVAKSQPAKPAGSSSQVNSRKPVRPERDASGAGGARVRLADIRIAWQLDGGCRGAATFDVEPGKASECPLWLPAGFRLVQTAVGGLPMPPAPLGPHSWLLPLGPERGLQRVEVVFDADPRQCPTDLPAEQSAGQEAAGQEPAGQGIEPLGTALPLAATRRRFRAPRLGDLPVEQTLWTIAGPASLAPGIVEPAAADDANRQADRLAATADQSPLSPPIAALWQSSLDDPEHVTRLAMQGRADSLTLRYEPAADGWPAGRLAPVALVVMLVLAALWLARRGVLGACFARWPWAFVVALGLAWWLWLWPSALGLLIAVAAVVLRLLAWLRGSRERVTTPLPVEASNLGR
jgi:hypothetical protein